MSIPVARFNRIGPVLLKLPVSGVRLVGTSDRDSSDSIHFIRKEDGIELIVIPFKIIADEVADRHVTVVGHMRGYFPGLKTWNPVVSSVTDVYTHFRPSRKYQSE